MSKKLKTSPEFSIFFNNLIRVCNNANTTPTAVANKFSNRSVLTAWKNGKIEIVTISEIAKYFNVSTDYLFGLDDIPNRKESLKSNLSDLEIELLTGFRQLDRDSQMRVMGRVETLQEDDKQKDSKLETA